MATLNADVIVTVFLDAFRGTTEMARQLEACTSDVERFAFTELCFKEQSIFKDFVPTIRFEGKNLTGATEVFKQGLVHLAGKRYVKALECFNKAVVLAPWRTRETPKEECDFCAGAVLAHRAIALFHMRRFAECVVDIDEALCYECPLGMKEQLMLLKAEVFLTVKRPCDAVFALLDEVAMLRLFLRELEEGQEPDESKKQYDKILARAEKEKTKALKKKNPSPAEPMSPKHPTYADMLQEVGKLDLKHGRSKKFPCASAGVELKWDKEFGRHFVAQKHFDIGDVVLVEPSFVSYLKTTTVLTCYCYACCLYTDTPFPCSKCTSIVFCSPFCASGPKGALHARECSFWKTFLLKAGGGSLEEPGPGNTNLSVVTAVRIMLTKTPEQWREFFSSVPDYASSENDGSSKIPKKPYRTDDYNNVFWLAKNTKHHPLEFIFEVALASVLAMMVLDQVYFVGENKIDPELRKNLGGLLIHHGISIATNWDCVREENMKGIDESPLGNAAAVLHTTASLFNHSCNPNLFAWHYGDVLVTKALCPVKPGDVLHVQKIGHFYETDYDIRFGFAAVMGFKCKCLPCLEMWPGLDHLVAASNVGCYRVKCMGCSQVFDTRASVGTRQRCPQCGRDVREWMLAYLSVHHELFPKGRRSGNWSGPKDVEALLPLYKKVYQLCGEPSYPVVFVKRVVEQWFGKQAVEVTHPGRRPKIPTRR